MLTSDLMHEALDDAFLDELAVRCGMPSGIGRLSFTSDRVLEDIASRMPTDDSWIADLGCGRGFFGRWLSRVRPSARYVGVDASAVAIAHARKLLPGGHFIVDDYRHLRFLQFHAIVLLDAFFADTIDRAFAERLTALLAPGGFFYGAVTAIDHRHASRFTQSIDTFRDLRCRVEVRDWTSDVEMETLHSASTWLEAEWPPSLRGDFHREASALVRAIERRTFSSISIVVVKSD